MERSESREKGGGEVTVDMARFENADYLLDLEESSVPSKKRLWDVALNDTGNGSVNASYTSFIKDVHNYWDAKFGEEEGEVKECCDDSTYGKFLHKLKVHENAYMLDVSEEKGVHHPIIYEEDNSIGNKVTRTTSEEDNSDGKVMRITSEKDNSIGKVMRTTSEVENSIGKVKRRTARISIGIRPPGKRYKHQGDDMKSVRENSEVVRTTSEEDNSIVKVMKTTARMSIGNGARGKRYIHQGDYMKSVREDSVSENVSCDELKRMSFDGVSSQKSLVEKSDLGNDHPDGMKESRRTTMSSKDDYVQENQGLDLDADQRSGTKSSDFGKKIHEADKEFGFFIKNLHVKGEHAYLEYGDNKRVYYENWDKQTTDVIVEPLETDTRPLASINKPLAPIPRAQTSPLKAQIIKSKNQTLRDAQNTLNTSNKILYDKEEVSLYWKELHDDLRRPYNQKEYDDLYAFISGRTPVLIHKESRSGGYNNKGHLGKSYLDLYPDLNREIEKVKSDSHRVLNLLRMFKIYMQKIPVIAVANQIKPWMNDVSKAILPGSSGDC